MDNDVGPWAGRRSLGDRGDVDPDMAHAGVILALLDASPSARPVLDGAIRLAEVMGAPVQALHMRTAPGSERLAVDLSSARGIGLEIIDDPVEEALLRLLATRHVHVGVVGARSTAGGRRPVGSVTRAIIERSPIPVLVVPPESVDPPPFRRALVPLEGTRPTSDPVRAWMPHLAQRMELVVLHVFTPETVPRMLDRPVRDMVMLSETFADRHLPGAAGTELRSGHAARHIVDMCRRRGTGAERGIDLVILSWLQPIGPGRAQTVQEVLSLSPLPTLLLPAGPHAHRAPAAPDTASGPARR